MSKRLFKKFFSALKDNRWGDASSSVDKLIKEDPLNPSHYIKKGDILQKEGMYTKAVKAYQAAADLFTKQGFFKKALAVYKIILRINPDNVVVIHNVEKIMAEIQSTGIKPAILTQSLQRQNWKKPEKEATIISDLFSSFSTEEIKEILSRAEIKHYSHGEMVIKEGDSGNSMDMIKEGSVRVVSLILGKNIELATLQEGDIFGEVAFLTGRVRTASVISEGPVVVYELKRSLLEEMIERRPEIMEYLNVIYHRRAEETLREVKDGDKR